MIQQAPEIIPIIQTLIGSSFAIGGFYFLINWRIKKLEEEQILNRKMNDRLIRIEELVKYIKENLGHEN